MFFSIASAAQSTTLDSFLKNEDGTYKEIKYETSTQDDTSSNTTEETTNEDEPVINTEDDDENDDDEEADTTTLRTVSDKKWQDFKNDKSFIYKHSKEKKKKDKPKELPRTPNWLKAIFGFLTSGFMKALLVLLLVSFVGYIIYSLIKNNDFKTRKKKQGIPINDIAPVENVIDTNWDTLLQKALANNDYNEATRVLYLQTLQLLHQKNYIIYSSEKTNWDYINAITNSSLKQPFTLLTRYFDYICYGKFTINETLFSSIQNQFRTFQESI
jgi:hypothetical protein